MERKKHVSENERKKDIIIYTLTGIILLIVFIIIIVMIPKGKDENQGGETLSSKVSETMEKEKAVNKTVEPKRDKKKVTIEVTSLTLDTATIKITDENEEDAKYEWYPNYHIEQEVDGEWEELILINQAGMMFEQVQLKEKNGVVSQALAWPDKYGKLKPGHYRIAKTANGTDFYGEFEITEEMYEAGTQQNEPEEVERVELDG